MPQTIRKPGARRSYGVRAETVVCAFATAFAIERRGSGQDKKWLKTTKLTISRSSSSCHRR